MKKSIVVTGSTGGIGLEIVKQYASEGWRVIAVCRSETEQLKESARLWENVEIYQFDLKSWQDMVAFKDKIGSAPIDVLCNNAASGDADALLQFGQLDFEKSTHLLEVNVLAPIKLTELLLENIACSEKKLVVMVSSSLASLEQNTGGSLLYRASKAALNSVARTLSHDLLSRNINVIALHPGSVRTKMGGLDTAELTPQQAVKQIKGLLDAADIDNFSGKFLSVNGTLLPW